MSSKKIVLMFSDTKIINYTKRIKKKLTKPSGPIFGAKDEVAPTSPPTHLKYTRKNNIRN